MAFSQTCSSGRPQISQSSDEPSSQDWKFVGREQQIHFFRLHWQREGLYERQKVLRRGILTVFQSTVRSPLHSKTAHNHSTYLHSACLRNPLKSMAQVKVKTQHLQVATFHFLLSQISQYGAPVKLKEMWQVMQ